MKTLKIGSRGPLVEHLQLLLVEHGYTLEVDAHFGDQTLLVVSEFQADVGLYDDGIVGSKTWAALGNKSYVEDSPTFIGTRRISFDSFGNSYTSGDLRLDAADALQCVVDELHEVGAVLTSSGTLRSPNTVGGKNRSSTSLHTLGLAIDLHVGSGMGHGDEPYVVEKVGRYWNVWARCKTGPEIEVNRWIHELQQSKKEAGKFVNLTTIFEENGFSRIRSRRSYSKNNYGGAEWWHFQFTANLISGLSTYGGELLKIYTYDRVSNTRVWKYRNAVFGKDWF